tara:strand:- start:634 stop:2484 length:1851 start_codon:yes stop_codon:yes gene_type:complete
MAIPFLNHLDVKGNIDLNDNQLQDFVVDHSTTANAGATAGKLIYDAGSLKYYDGANSQWQTLGTGTGSGSVTSVAISGTDGIQVDSGSPITTSGTITLGLNAIPNDKLSNSTVSYGGVTLSLGGSDATPAFDLSDATDYPTSSLVGTITNAQLAGSIANAKLANSSVSYGGVSLSLGGSDATPAFDLSDATNYPTSSLSGTITNAQLAGSIANAKLANSSITIDGSAIALGGSVSTLQLGTTSSTALAGDTTVDDVSVANLKTRLAGGFASNAVQIGDSSDIVTIGNDLVVTGDLTVSGDTITANVGTLDVEDKNITVNKSSGDSSSTADGAGLTIQDAVNASTDASMLWNATNDKFVFSHLIEAPGTSIFASLDISGDVDVDGTLETDALSINGTTITATGAELNILDGVTSTTAELNILDGVTSTAAELNALDGYTGSVTELNYLDSLHATGVTATEYDYLDGVTSSIQTQLDAKLAKASNLSDVASASTSRTNLGLAYASSAESKAGTASAKVLSPDLLAERSITATIDVSAMDSTALKAVIDHDLGTHNVIVETSFVTSKEVVICEYHKDNNGSASTDHLTFHFASVPSEDILVTVTSAKGANTITPSYPNS